MCDRIENAAVTLFLNLALRRVAAVPEQPFENGLRVDFHWERLRGGLPGDGVHIGATVAIIANAGVPDILDTELDGGQHRVPADLSRDHLIHSRTKIDIRACRMLRSGAAKERGRGSHMIAAAFAWGGTSGLHFHAAHNHQLLAKGLQWFENAGEL